MFKIIHWVNVIYSDAKFICTFECYLHESIDFFFFQFLFWLFRILMGVSSCFRVLIATFLCCIVDVWCPIYALDCCLLMGIAWFVLFVVNFVGFLFILWGSLRVSDFLFCMYWYIAYWVWFGWRVLTVFASGPRNVELTIDC